MSTVMWVYDDCNHPSFFDTESNLLTIRTVDNQTIIFDITSGLIVERINRAADSRIAIYSAARVLIANLASENVEPRFSSPPLIRIAAEIAVTLCGFVLIIFFSIKLKRAKRIENSIPKEQA